eukprot:g4050.t1
MRAARKQKEEFWACLASFQKWRIGALQQSLKETRQHDAMLLAKANEMLAVAEDARRHEREMMMRLHEAQRSALPVSASGTVDSSGSQLNAEEILIEAITRYIGNEEKRSLEFMNNHTGDKWRGRSKSKSRSRSRDKSRSRSRERRRGGIDGPSLQQRLTEANDGRQVPFILGTSTAPSHSVYGHVQSQLAEAVQSSEKSQFSRPILTPEKGQNRNSQRGLYEFQSEAGNEVLFSIGSNAFAQDRLSFHKAAMRDATEHAISSLKKLRHAARMKVKVDEHGSMEAGGQKKGSQKKGSDGNNMNIQRNAIQKYSSIARGRSGKDLEREMNAFVHRQAEMKGKIVYL